ncbi:barstar family protein [Burkholderia sp. Ac-20379]|uniref:barstar family protein n=1 Tax=Burkholderia sp. Ac-20379 TaxID=2703900 RepID=UPI00197ED8DF|nr:barnase inhibitor [Burkholderia sp. Ac-20379]
MVVGIDGRQIRSEADFHVAIGKALNFPSYYGKNLDALWDALSANVEWPVRIIWCESSMSQAEMSEDFGRIVEILRKV